MLKKIFISIFGLILGIILGYFILLSISIFSPNLKRDIRLHSPIALEKNQVVGFLPYWLLDKAQGDYSKYISTLTYFGLGVGEDGKIQKLNSPIEEEPGWTDLRTGKLDKFFNQAKKDNIKLSLLMFNGNEESIAKLISDPISHAKNLIDDVSPLMKKFGFTDLNLDIENVKEASDSARQNFTAFVQEVRNGMDENNLGTLTIDASPTVLIKNYLINLTDVSRYADYIVLMTYDYHFPGSFVTGPVSPDNGAGVDSEFDTETAIKEALKIMPAKEILLGSPLYGYEWESIGDVPRSAVIPGTGIAASNMRVEDFLSKCSSCSAKFDNVAKESYLIFKDEDTGTYHQIFYPDDVAMQAKLGLATKYNLAGVALWALGYEGDKILDSLLGYK